MKLFKIATLIFLSSLFFACEDDPIVEPASTDDDTCTGSYCKLSFPDSVQVASFKKINPNLF